MSEQPDETPDAVHLEVEPYDDDECEPAPDWYDEAS